jgi:hypothetical protein
MNFMSNIIQQDCNILGLVDQIPATISEDGKEFLTSCLVVDPQKR